MKNDDKLPSLDELDASIKKAKKALEEKENGGNNSSGMLRTSVDLLAGVLVGSFIGYQIDKWLDTLPIFFIICFFLGVAGSALNIYRSVNKDNTKE